MKEVIAIVLESANNLATYPTSPVSHTYAPSLPTQKGTTTHLTNPPNIFISILLTKPQILVQSKTHVIAIEPVRRETEMQKVLFKGCGDCGFAGRAEACEPDCEALLFAEGVAFGAGEGRVPCYIAVVGWLVGLWWVEVGGKGEGFAGIGGTAYVAMIAVLGTGVGNLCRMLRSYVKRRSQQSLINIQCEVLAGTARDNAHARFGRKGSGSWHH